MGRFRSGAGGDPRNKVGQNPTGRPTRSSAGKRRQEVAKLERDLEGTPWAAGEAPEDEGEVSTS
jgi:hypothetical protein